MKVIFKTNIDAYESSCWPTNVDYLPAVGNKVHVIKLYFDYYINKKFPTSLEVVGVNITENGVLVDLHYTKTDIELAKINGIKLFG